MILCASVRHNPGFNPPQLHFLAEPLLIAPSAPIKLGPPLVRLITADDNVSRRALQKTTIPAHPRHRRTVTVLTRLGSPCLQASDPKRGASVSQEFPNAAALSHERLGPSTISWKVAISAAAAASLLLAVGPGIKDGGDRLRQGNSEGCLKPELGPPLEPCN